jgi:hypothetical protein
MYKHKSKVPDVNRIFDVASITPHQAIVKVVVLSMWDDI